MTSVKCWLLHVTQTKIKDVLTQMPLIAELFWAVLCTQHILQYKNQLISALCWTNSCFQLSSNLFGHFFSAHISSDTPVISSNLMIQHMSNISVSSGDTMVVYYTMVNNKANWWSASQSERDKFLFRLKHVLLFTVILMLPYFFPALNSTWKMSFSSTTQHFCVCHVY